jgi:ubiquitin carboxyl-terminal hydrolase 5/13
MTKLAISAETDEDRYNTTTSVGCYSCDAHDIDASSGKVEPLHEATLIRFSWQKWLME